MDLESAKDRDTKRYYEIWARLRESFNQCGMVCICDLCALLRVVGLFLLKKTKYFIEENVNVIIEINIWL